jgi:outer membrane lipoprotein-sorting protein
MLGDDYVDPKDRGTLNVPEILKMSDLKQGEDDGVLKTPTWTVTVSKTLMPAASKPMPIKLWYDPKSLKPVKRTATIMKGDVEVKWSETYENITLNADIPDEKFKLPEEKK